MKGQKLLHYIYFTYRKLSPVDCTA